MFRYSPLWFMGLLLMPGLAHACIAMDVPWYRDWPTYLIAFLMIQSFVYGLAVCCGWVFRKIKPAQVAGCGFHILMLAAALSALICTLFGGVFYPYFAKTYADFGVELPAPSLLLQNGRHGLWLCLPVVLLIWRGIGQHPRRNWLAALASVGFAALLLLILLAIYAPIFKLGACA